MGVQAGTIRRNRERDEEHVGEGRMEKGLRGEGHTGIAHFWLDGRQSAQEVREHGMVEGMRCRIRGRHFAHRNIVRCVERVVPCSHSTYQCPDENANLWYLQ